MASKRPALLKLCALLLHLLVISIGAFAQSKAGNVEDVLQRIKAAGISNSEADLVFAIVDSFYRAPALNRQEAELKLMEKHTGDSLTSRLAIYYMASKLAENCGSKPQTIKEGLIKLLAIGTNDASALVRQSTYNYLVDNECWFTGIANNKEVLQSFEKMITSYSSEIPFGLFRIFGEQQLRGLEPAIKQAYYRKPPDDVSGNGEFYDSQQWAAIFLLAQWGDEQSIDYILNILDSETIPELKYRELAKVCMYLSGRKVTAFIYKTVMSPEVEELMEPLGKGGNYAPTYFSYFLMDKLPVLFRDFPVAGLDDLKLRNSTDKDLDKKLLAYCRSWLQRNRSKFE